MRLPAAGGRTRMFDSVTSRRPARSCGPGFASAHAGRRATSRPGPLSAAVQPSPLRVACAPQCLHLLVGGCVLVNLLNPPLWGLTIYFAVTRADWVLDALPELPALPGGAVTRDRELLLSLRQLLGRPPPGALAPRACSRADAALLVAHVGGGMARAGTARHGAARMGEDASWVVGKRHRTRATLGGARWGCPRTRAARAWRRDGSVRGEHAQRRIERPDLVAREARAAVGGVSPVPGEHARNAGLELRRELALKQGRASEQRPDLPTPECPASPRTAAWRARCTGTGASPGRSTGRRASRPACSRRTRRGRCPKRCADPCRRCPPRRTDRTDRAQAE